MPPTVFLSNDPDRIEVNKLVSGVRTKKIALADIQRASVWDKQRPKQLDLFRSLYLGIPVGVLYIWTPAENSIARSRQLHGLEDYYDAEKVEGLILDGQQRTTALCRLHFSKTETKAHLMDRLVLTLSGDARIENVFRFEKDFNYEAKSNEVVIQKLMEAEGLTNETDRINNSNLEPELKIDYTSKLGIVLTAFTTRKIGIQWVNQNSDLNDALRIFSTVNQAGVALADQDFIQAILTSIYPEIHTKIYSLEKTLQNVQTGEDEDGNPTYGKLSGFKRDVIMKAILWELYRTTKRKDSIVNDNLCIYKPKSINQALTKPWNKMSLEEKRNVTEDLSLEKVKEVFDKISTAAKRFKDVLKDELFFYNTTGHSDNSILGGIIYYANNPTPSEANKGKLLLWYILGSYHLEWTGGSTDVKVNDTCNAMSHPAGADWDKLWKQMQENSQIDKKTFSGEHSDLYPKLGQDEFPGKQSKTTGNATGIIVQLLERSLQRIYRMRDWFTGEQLGNLKHREFSIHHIFPQSRFKNNKFTTKLIKSGFSFVDIEDAENHTRIKQLLDDAKTEIDSYLLSEGEVVNRLSTEINSIAESITHLNDSEEDNTEEIASQKKHRKAIMKRKNDISRNIVKKNEEAGKYISAIDKYNQAGTNESKAEALASACEFWYSWCNKKAMAVNHPANKVSIKRGTNSAIGNSWPEDYLNTLLPHESRIQKQFIDLSDMSLFDRTNFADFINSRLSLQHRKLIEFFDSLYEGTWTEVSPQSENEPAIEDLIADDAELLAERKETIFYDVTRGDATWNLLKNGDKAIDYLLHSVVRAVLAYGNSGGGYVIVGVADTEGVVGLERDINLIREKYEISKIGAKDKISQYINQALISCSQAFVHNCVKLIWCEVESKEVLLIKVRGSNEAVLHKKYPKYIVKEDGALVFKENVSKIHWIRLNGRTEEKKY